MTNGLDARSRALPLPCSAASPSPSIRALQTPDLRPRFDTLSGMPGAVSRPSAAVPPPPPSVPPPLPAAALAGHLDRQLSAERDALTDTELPTVQSLRSFAQTVLSKQQTEPAKTPPGLGVSPPDSGDTFDSDRPSSPPTVRSVRPPELVVEANRWSLRAPLAMVAAAVALATVLVGSLFQGVTSSATSAAALGPSATVLSSQVTAIATAVEEHIAARAEAAQHLAAQQSDQGTIVASASKRSCHLWISGTPYGASRTVRVSVPAGEHIVACRLSSGQTLLRRVYVERGAVLYESF